MQIKEDFMDNYDPNNWNDNNNTNQNQNINGNQHPNQNYFNNDYPVPPAKPKDKLATFSLILAIRFTRPIRCINRVEFHGVLHQSAMYDFSNCTGNPFPQPHWTF